MYDVMIALSPWVLVVILPALGIVSVFFHLNVKSRSSLVLMLGLVIVGLSAIAALCFPLEAYESIVIESKDDLAKVMVGDSIQRRIVSNETGATVSMILYDVGFLITFFGFTSLTMRTINRDRAPFVALALAVAFLGTDALAQEDGVDGGGDKAFSIPLLDLAAETGRQVVVDREEGQYLGHPTTVLLEDGKTIIAVYPKGHGRGAIVMKRSSDGGLSWSERLPVPESWSTSKETPTIQRAVDPAGRRRLILFSGLYPIRMSSSDDGGATWSELAPIGDFGGIVAMSSLVRLRDGRLMALFHDDGRFLHDAGGIGRFQVFKTLSADGGLTWSAPEIVTEHPQAHLCEPGAVRSPDGARLALLLRENSRAFNSFVIFSDDEGETWTEPRELPAALTGDRHTAKYAPDGRLFITFRDMAPNSPAKGDWVGWVGTFADIAGGREGQYRVRLMDNTAGADCGYAGLELLPDGTFVATSYGHWTAGAEPYIVTVRFTLAELDAAASRQAAGGARSAGSESESR